MKTYKTYKTALMDYCETFGKDAEFTYKQLHDFVVIEFFKRHNPEDTIWIDVYEDEDGNLKFTDLTYKECIERYLAGDKVLRKRFRGQCSTLFDNPDSYNGTGCVKKPSRVEPRYLKKLENGKYKLVR